MHITIMVTRLSAAAVLKQGPRLVSAVPLDLDCRNMALQIDEQQIDSGFASQNCCDITTLERRDKMMALPSTRKARVTSRNIAADSP